jgi:hypothetical protein
VSGTDNRLRIVVCGLLAQYPLGGVAWDYGQYVLGLHRLGHDVYYLEDTGQWPYNPREGGVSKGWDFNVAWLASLMERFGLGDRWAYRCPHGPRWHGLSDAARRDVLGSADLLVNVSGTLARPEAYRAVKRLAFVDSDPVFTQIKLARGQADFRRAVDAHDVHFSFGEALGAPVPETGHRWRPTRQPVVLSAWAPEAPPREVFTTVLNWTSYKAVEWQGRTYGQKDVEFRDYLDLPARVGDGLLEIAVNAGKTERTPYDLLRRHGWRVVDPQVACADLDGYRDYVRSSMGEWSVAKNGYVVGKPGWFSCRSACYLAAGRPVVVQDTGFGAVLPVGDGLLSFDSPEGAAQAIEEVRRRHAHHADAARALAETWFDADKVLTCLIETAMGRRPGTAAAPR